MRCVPTSIKGQADILLYGPLQVLHSQRSGDLLEEPQTLVEHHTSSVGIRARFGRSFDLLLGFEDDDIVGTTKAAAPSP